MTTLALTGPWGATTGGRARLAPFRPRRRGGRAACAAATAVLAVAVGVLPGAPRAVPATGRAPAMTERAADTAAWPMGLEAAARSAIEADRYAVAAPKLPGRAWEAANPAQGFAASFGPAGISVRPTDGDWTWGLELQAYGYADALGAPPAPAITADANRVEYRRGPLTEWYVNDAQGIEQGFTLAARPPTTTEAEATPGHSDDNRPLVVELALSGHLAATVDSGGDGLELAGSGAHLRYDGLYAYDATGRDLPAQMALDGATLRLEIDDTGASYPLTIDPLISVPHVKLAAPDGGANGAFGESVAMAGDTAVVGAGLATPVGGPDTGAAYVFHRAGESWSLQARLTASDGAAADYFGLSVAISGDTVAIGAPGDDTTAGGNAGSVYVFVREGTVWSEQARLTANDAAALDDFGWAVAVSGDTVVVGAPSDDTADLLDIGSAYAFHRDGEVWSQQAKLIPSDAAAYSDYGDSVALSGNTALVGTAGDGFLSSMGAGAAAVFVYDGSGWSEQAILTASDGDPLDYFGESVAISGDTAVVGAGGDDTADVINAGSAYVFVRSGASWSQQAKLSAFGGAEVGGFGQSVAVAGDTAVVGTINDAPAGSFSGSAYVFKRAGENWTGQFQVIAPDGAERDFFGGAVALSGNAAIIGAYGDDSPQGDGTGSTYVVDLSRPPSFVPTLSVDDVSVLEGSSGKRTARFTVALSDPSPVTVSVRARTASFLSARASIDYVPRTTILTFAPNQTTLTFDVKVKGDTAIEGDETFYVELDRPKGAVIARARGTGTIVNDD